MPEIKAMMPIFILLIMGISASVYFIHVTAQLIIKLRVVIWWKVFKVP